MAFLIRGIPLFSRCAWLSAILALVAWASPVALAQSGGWEVAKIEGRDYVSAESIKKFYNFTKMTRSGASVVLENSKVELKLRIGAHECLMNNVKFVFTYAVAEQGSQAYVSRLDLTKLVDPVLRPNFIQNAGDFRTVILDPGHGGKDPGATNALGTEAGYNLKVAGRVKALLERRDSR